MKNILTTICLVFLGLGYGQTPPSSEPLFLNSIVSTDIDFIELTDPDAFVSLTYTGQFMKEMPDSESEILFDSNTYVFEASFAEGHIVELWCHSSFGSLELAQEYAEKAAPRLGKLPEFMRTGLTHVVIHNGDAGAFSDAEFFVLYSENMDVRISNNDLEETIFHETVHAALDGTHASSAGWLAAQTADVNFITNYAQGLPALEDLAETTIFAYTMLKYPGRLSESIESWVNTHIPYRLGYIMENIFPEFISTEDFKEMETKAALTLFPNPASSVINFNVGNSVNNTTPLIIYNTSGQFVCSINVKQGNNTVDISDLTNGIYFVKVRGYQWLRLVVKS